ncbi:MAG: hypothetical protein AVDCRST_MAG30-1408, partial [uncultured Solirubrobacteraceae bacterium]
ANHRATRLPRRALAGPGARPHLLPRRPGHAARRPRRLRAVGRRHLLRHLAARADGHALRRAEGQPVAPALRRRGRDADGARGEGRAVLRRHVRHGRLPHGDLHGPGRQRAHAPPAVRAHRRL